MTSRDFCFWLQGVFEIGKVKSLDLEQTEMIKRHLALVFTHEIDPSMGGSAMQARLDAIHKATSEPHDVFTSIAGEAQTLNGPIRYRC